MSRTTTTAAFFFAGTGIAFLAMWFSLREETPLASSPVAPQASIREDSAQADSFTPASPAHDESSAERAQRIVDSTLTAMRAGDPQKRAALSVLMLKQLAHEGPAGVVALTALLATGEDFPLGPLLKVNSITIMSGKRLRQVVIFALARSPEPGAWPVAREEALRSIHTTHSMEDAADFIALVEKREPGAHRADAVAAMLRVMAVPDNGWNPEVSGAFQPLLVMAHYGAAELLPAVEAAVLRHPEAQLTDFLGALWSLPAATREDALRRVLADESSLAALEKNPALNKLDQRSPTAQQFTAAWFASEHPEYEKARQIDALALTDYWEPTNHLISRASSDKPPHLPGAPGTPEQARARLSLLEQIAPSCPEPLLQEKIAAARAALQKQLASP